MKSVVISIPGVARLALASGLALGMALSVSHAQQDGEIGVAAAVNP